MRKAGWLPCMREEEVIFYFGRRVAVVKTEGVKEINIVFTISLTNKVNPNSLWA